MFANANAPLNTRYLAFMAVHDGCTNNNAGSKFKGLGKQAPLATVNLYNRTTIDTYKVAHAMCVR